MYSKINNIESVEGESLAEPEKGELAAEKKKFSWLNAFHLLKDYFVNSDEKLVAWLSLFGIIVCITGLVALTFALTWWWGGFIAAFTAKALVPFLISLGEFVLIIAGSLGLNTLKNYLIGSLSISWRNWLTKKFMTQLFGSENNFLELKRTSPEIDNIGQRVQQDIKTFVELTLNLGAGFIRSTLNLVLFAYTLWIVGGSLAIGLNIVIPGYLVWVALIIAIVATITTHYIGKSLTKSNKEIEAAEADLRLDVTKLTKQAENISLEGSENYYQQAIESRVDKLTVLDNNKLKTQSKLNAFQEFYLQASNILPYLMAAPLYFTGMIGLEQVFESSMAFGQVSSSLGWFVDTYQDGSSYKTAIERLTELQSKMEDSHVADHKAIIHKERDKETIKIKGLTIKHPLDPDKAFLRNLNLELKPGEHILIKGKSGLGKSTFFKTISGDWKYGKGKISIPAGQSMYFLPQEPSLPKDTLWAILAYEKTYTLEECAAALMAVGGMEKFIPRLEEVADWGEILSGGEQQRISVARALLREPTWLFLDEITSKLDEAAEAHVYKVLKGLKSTTLISIGHRSTVEKYHSKIAFFNANEENEVTVEVESVAPGLV